MPVFDSLYDHDGRPLDVTSWSELLADDEFHSIDSDRVGAYLISTVWLGVEHGRDAEDRPLIFETMVFATPGDDRNLGLSVEARRYATESEARIGHDDTVTLVRATSVPDLNATLDEATAPHPVDQAD